MTDERNDPHMLGALDRILAAMTSSHWNAGKSIEDLRRTLVDGVKVVGVAHQEIDEQTALKLDSLPLADLEQLIDKLDLPARFPNAKLWSDLT